MKDERVYDLEFPYWFGKRIGITSYKMSNGVLRIGIWKLDRLGKEYGSYEGEWGTNWWKFIDIGRKK